MQNIFSVLYCKGFQKEDIMENMNNFENDNFQQWQQEELPVYQRELSRKQYNVLIGVHLLYGLALTAFICM